MKRIIIATAALMGFAACSFGQGETTFGNGIPATRVYTNNLPNGWQNQLTSSSGSGTNVAGAGQVNAIGGQYTFALFSANLGVNAILGAGPWTDGNWAFTGAYGTNSAVTTGGRIFGQQNADGSVTIPGHPPATSANLVVIGWNTAIGGTTLAEFITAWNSAQSGALGLVYGYSSIATKLLADGTAVASSSFFGTTSGAIPGFVLSPVVVPEPATFALAGLGAAALLIFRRRK